MRDATQSSEIQSFQFAGIRYYRYTDDGPGYAHGDLCLLEEKGDRVVRTIPAFPHINRVYRLRPGIKHVFGQEPFMVEEKLDGYNVRIFRHGDRLLAATRGGLICPFTTEWTDQWRRSEWLDAFFEDHPEAVLCGEVVGDNPYNHQRDPTLSPGAHFFLFDVLIPGRGRIAPKERYQLMQHYHLPGTPCWGEFNHQQADRLFNVLYDLNQRTREGVVMKSMDGRRVVKFVTPNKDLEDIRDGLIMNFDLPTGHFWNRIVRATLFIQEFQLDPSDYSRRIGKAFLDGLAGLEDFRRSEQHYVIYVRRKETWEATRDTIASRVRLVTDSIEPATLDGQDMLRIRFRRIHRLSTHRFHSILKGFPHTD